MTYYILTHSKSYQIIGQGTSEPIQTGVKVTT